MKIGFVEVRYKGRIDLPKKLLDELPKRIILFTAIQYHNQLPRWKEELESLGKQIIIVKPKHSIAEGHLLGCGIEEWPEAKDADAFLYVGDGLFHPKALVVNNTLPVWCYDPKREEYFVLQDEDIERAKRKEKAAYSAFLMAKRVGVLVTIKTGQQRLNLSLKLREKFPEKEFLFFLYDSLNFQSLEDFPFVEVWVNTMCPRIGLDDTNKIEKPILNIGKLGVTW